MPNDATRAKCFPFLGTSRANLLRRPPLLNLRILLLHIADDGLPALVHVDVLDADKLLAAVTQASKNLNLHCISP